MGFAGEDYKDRFVTERIFLSKIAASQHCHKYKDIPGLLHLEEGPHSLSFYETITFYYSSYCLSFIELFLPSVFTTHIKY